VIDVLIIDDELEVIDHLKDFFDLRGFRTATAATGEEGLKLMEQEKPTLVLLDMKLGAGISGMEVLRQAKQNKSDSQIVVITAVDDQNVASLSIGLGAIDYITKPFKVMDLEKIVLSHLKMGGKSKS